MNQMEEEPLVTIVVVPREKFSFSRESLEGILENTDVPFRLVYVDGRSPEPVQRYLDERARQFGFRLLRSDSYLSPNRARNVGLREVSTKYVLFSDNDVIVTPGWLSHLLQCAEETEAAIVSPLICQGKPFHETVHFAGGRCTVRESTRNGRVERQLVDTIESQGSKLETLRLGLERRRTELAEFHSMLVRTSIFERTGPLDESLLSTREHIDFCLTVSEAGGAIYLEPASVVTYAYDSMLRRSDLHYYMLRWSDTWELRSLERMREKWQLYLDPNLKVRRARLGWRRRLFLLRPLVASLTGGLGGKLFQRGIERLLYGPERILNKFISWHSRRTPSEPFQSLN
jgi:GT2 family glycosyltransferase